MGAGAGSRAASLLPPARHDGSNDVLPGEHYDIVVCGGGITGAGIARDAALRGLKVALLEQRDFGSGTSSKSSKLIHGGLRYLQQFELRLVFEGTSERAVQMAVAPHLVRPIPFLVPVYRGQSNGLNMIDAGLWLYDALALFRVPKIHRTYRGKKALGLEPGLATDDLRGILEYYDCLTDDARLVLENILDAKALGADVRSYTRATEVVRDARGGVVAVRAHDELTGTTDELPTTAVVVAAGPWTDTLLPELKLGAGRALLRPTKGVHLVVDHARLPVSHAITLFTRDKRAMFCLPWIERTVIGTTDTDERGDPSEVAASLADVEYLCNNANEFFPSAKLGPDDVIATWAGLRPLIAADESRASDVSREHHLFTRPEGVVVIAGGKLTTYRRMAKEAVDAAAKLLASRNGHGKLPKSSTRRRPLPGAVGLAEPTQAAVEQLARDVERTAGVPARVATHLAQTYGTRASTVTALANGDASRLQRIDPELPYVWAEVRHAVEHELARTVEDVLVRRIPLCLRGKDQGLGAAPRVAEVLGNALGWTPAEHERQLGAYRRYVDGTRRYRQA
jgi:glycerol-3-phosphate dehydrogenase